MAGGKAGGKAGDCVGSAVGGSGSTGTAAGDVGVAGKGAASSWLQLLNSRIKITNKKRFI